MLIDGRASNLRKVMRVGIPQRLYVQMKKRRGGEKQTGGKEIRLVFPVIRVDY